MKRLNHKVSDTYIKITNSLTHSVLKNE